MQRRQFLQVAGTSAAAWMLPPPSRQGFAAEEARGSMTLGFGTYGMQGLSVERAVDVLAGIGYDSVELDAAPGWDTEPARLMPARRQELRKRLEDKGLKLTSFMVDVKPTADPQQHAAVLESLKQVVQLGNDLAPDAPPLIQTTLGGGEWAKVRAMYVERLADWVKVGQAGRTVMAIKPHRGGAMSRPSEAIWIIEQLDGTPWLRMVYDYSHYIFRDLPLEETIRTAAPFTAHLAVKDTVQEGNSTTFKLAGESGQIDYARLLKLFHAAGYRGDVSCEVSGMIWKKPGYDPLAAAQTCYKHMARAFEEAGIPRPRPVGRNSK
jgi:inosose dehydratase